MSDDIYVTAAKAHHRMSVSAPNYEESLRWLATQQQFRWAVDAARAPLLAEVDEARQLLEYALHLRMYGERAPGGNETWREFDRRCEAFLQARIDQALSDDVAATND